MVEAVLCLAKVPWVTLSIPWHPWQPGATSLMLPTLLLLTKGTSGDYTITTSPISVQSLPVTNDRTLSEGKQHIKLVFCPTLKDSENCT